MKKAVGNSQEVAVFHRVNRHRVFSVPLSSEQIALSEDVIAFVSGDILQIWDIPTQTPLYTVNQPGSQVKDLTLRVDKEAKTLELAIALTTGEYSCSTWNVELQLVEQECVKCKKTGEKMKKCGRCGTANYCSPECQKSHWPLHKAFCAK